MFLPTAAPQWKHLWSRCLGEKVHMQHVDVGYWRNEFPWSLWKVIVLASSHKKALSTSYRLQTNVTFRAPLSLSEQFIHEQRKSLLFSDLESTIEQGQKLLRIKDAKPRLPSLSALIPKSTRHSAVSIRHLIIQSRLLPLVWGAEKSKKEKGANKIGLVKDDAPPPSSRSLTMHRKPKVHHSTWSMGH